MTSPNNPDAGPRRVIPTSRDSLNGIDTWLRGLGDVLRAERALRRMTQEDVARQAGMSLRSYSRYENGERISDVAQFREIASAFGLDGSELMGRIESRAAALNEAEDF